jgi:hypothetical protein
MSLQYFFLPKNRFLATELKRGKGEIEIFSNQLFWWSNDIKNVKPAFYEMQNRGV